MRPRTFLAWAAGVVAAVLLLPHAAATPRNRAQPHAPAPPETRAGLAPPTEPSARVAAVPTSAPVRVHPAPEAAVPSAPGRAGMVVGVDPETGQLGMPTAGQMAELSPREQSMISRSGAGLVQVHHPDGSVSIDLQGRFQELVIARIGTDGKPVYGCLDDAKALRRALRTRPVPPLEEK